MAYSGKTIDLKKKKVLRVCLPNTKPWMALNIPAISVKCEDSTESSQCFFKHLCNKYLDFYTFLWYNSTKNIQTALHVSVSLNVVHQIVFVSTYARKATRHILPENLRKEVGRTSVSPFLQYNLVSSTSTHSVTCALNEYKWILLSRLLPGELGLQAAGCTRECLTRTLHKFGIWHGFTEIILFILKKNYWVSKKIKHC